jgi:hypothetical protein
MLKTLNEKANLFVANRESISTIPEEDDIKILGDTTQKKLEAAGRPWRNQDDDSNDQKMQPGRTHGGYVRPRTPQGNENSAKSNFVGQSPDEDLGRWQE